MPTHMSQDAAAECSKYQAAIGDVLSPADFKMERYDMMDGPETLFMDSKVGRARGCLRCMQGR